VRGEVAWRLDSRQAGGKLNVRLGALTHALAPGETIAMPGGRLRFEAIRGWMGYKVFRDPALPWLFVSASLALAGLLWHLVKSRIGQPNFSSRRVEATHGA
jgi:hypothetical protein